MALAMVGTALALSLISFGIAIRALATTSLQPNTFVNLFGIVFAGVGGALVPLAVLPEWLQHSARLVPTYWAMDGFLE